MAKLEAGRVVPFLELMFPPLLLAAAATAQLVGSEFTHARMHTQARTFRNSLSLSLHKLLHKDHARSPCWCNY